MKSATQNNSQNSNTRTQNKQRPDIRDNMDHREGEENLMKGDDVTHNQKETKENRKKMPTNK